MNNQDYSRLDGKVAVITGGARGIGRASAELLAHYGASVVIADIKGAEKTAKEMTSLGFDSYAVEVNLTEKASIDKMIDAIMKEYGRIDILINCAGVGDRSAPPDITEKNWDFVVDVDLKGTHLCSQAVCDIMSKQGGGKIVNIASSAGQMGGMYIGVSYTAAKGGVIALTKGYARWAAQFGINVNCIAPGLIYTDMTADRGDDPNTVPLKRLGTALDCAKAVYFLSSCFSDYITGATIDVNGGVLMR